MEFRANRRDRGNSGGLTPSSRRNACARTVMTTVTWAAGSGDWGDAANWSGNAVPDNGGGQL